MEWKNEMKQKLTDTFPGSIFNEQGEFIAHPFSHTSFNFEICENETEIKCKVLEYCSRAASKGIPYSSDKKNRDFNKFMTTCINNFLKTNFDDTDMAVIYQKLGNTVRHTLSIQFVESGYDMALLN